MPEGNTPSTSGSNKMWYIIGGIVILALVGWFLMRGVGSLTGVDVDQAGNGATTYSNEEGSVTVGSGASMPSNWPSDAPANYAGASIVYSGTSNPQTGQSGSAVSYTVRASATSVADYYKQQLTSAGWTIESTANIAGAMVVAAKKDTRTMGVYITDTADGNVTVVAGIEL
ncbi:LPXTG cell wall anchor domain-containing protein [Candidatus Kaiserbacteria bacterium]|nr:LPXTG cell wall anchor domain-containing protein [Candidatus Kaiserbacteria bacterium]